MKLIRNEQAYAEILGGFVHRRMSAQAFLSRFAQLWRDDDEQSPAGASAAVPMTRAQSDLCGLLDSINDLCEAYWRSLPPGCGYRVSEEQFRKQVQTMASTNRILDAGQD